jgi:hypothetical protein
MTSPTKLAHVVYMTRRFDEMITWFQKVFEAMGCFESCTEKMRN